MEKDEGRVTTETTAIDSAVQKTGSACATPSSNRHMGALFWVLSDARVLGPVCLSTH